MATIKSSASTMAASIALQQNFLLDAEQAKAVLDMKLSRLAHLEVKKLNDERENLINEANRIDQILKAELLMNEEIKSGLHEVAKNYGDARRTKIISLSTEENEPVEVKTLQVSLTNHNNLFVTEASSLYTQKRGAVGNKLKMENGEYVIATQSMETNDNVLFFTRSGNYYHCAASALPIGEKISTFGIIPIKDNESICAITNLRKDTTANYILFFTRNGLVKKTELSEYNITKNMAMRAINLDDGDEIINIVFTNEEKVGILTEQGNFIIIETSDIRPIGRVARGIRAIKLNPDDYVKSARAILSTAKFIVSITGNGYIKSTSINEFTTQSKNTKGTKLQRLTEGDWMADFAPLKDEKELLIVATRSCLKLDTTTIPVYSKGAQGVKSIKLTTMDNVTQISIY